MSSRMERYYKDNNSRTKRSQINQDLYRNIYDTSEYTNIEGIATMEHTNEIDISKIKNMLKNREEYKKQKEYRNLVEKKVEEPYKIEEIGDEDKNYDIRDILSKVVQKKSDDDKYRSLDETDFHLLQELKNDREKRNDEVEDDELKELINTITNTSMLNKLADKDLSLDLLGDLKSTDTTKVASKDSIKAIIEEAKSIEKKEKDVTDDTTNSFYTKSLNFGKKDYDMIGKELELHKKRTRIIKFIVILIVVAVLATIGVLIFNFIN